MERPKVNVNDTVTVNDNKEVRSVTKIGKNDQQEPIIFWESKRYSGVCIPEVWLRWKQTGKDEYL